jgi:trehalose 6-phosphate phosphatase
LHAVTRDALPPFSGAALLLDLDGTLLDIAPTPDSVVVPPDLPGVLRTLRGQLQNALAVVTGRPIEVIDALLDDAPHAVAGEHGGAVRHEPGGAIERPDLRTPSAAWLEQAAALEAAWPGTMLERKARGFGLHFRLAPDAGQAIHDGLAALVQGSPDFELMEGKMLWEVRPKGADKGHAVKRLMARAPFLGRLPVFIGDDVTDEDGMRVARPMGGAGLRVPDVFGDAAGCRAWLAATAARGDWAPFP